MSLFPQVSPEIFEEKDRDILDVMSNFYSQSMSINQSFWAEADTDSRFEAGDQTLWSDIYGNLPAAQRKHFNFNRIKRVVNMISGHQRRNRKSTAVIPVENGDQETADQFTKILSWQARGDGTLETLSDSFHGAVTTGLNLLRVRLDYRSDPISGDIAVDNCAYNSFLIDPFFRKRDLSDCNAIWKRTFITRQEALSLLPDKADIISHLQLSGKDGKFNFMPESYDFSVNNLMAYDEYYYRAYRAQKLMVDVKTGEALEWKGKDQEGLTEFLRIYPQVTMIEQQVPTVRVALVLQGKVMYDGPNPLGIDQYPFIPVFGYFNPQIPHYPWRIQGVVRGLRDAQFLYNRRKVIELDILESQVNSGYIYKESALINPKDVFMAGQGKGVALKHDAQMTDIQQIQAPQIPPSMIELSKILAQEVQEISGVSEELLGSAVDDKAGILSMLRQSAGLTTLQTLYDNLDFSQKLLGKVLIDVIQSNFTPGKVKRILETEPLPQFYNKAFGKYDAAIEEGQNTTTQRQMQFAQLLHLKEAGLPIPDDVLINAATIQDKNDLIKSIEQQQQQQAQQQQQQEQVAMQETQARTELAQARATADRGLGMERVSRIEENQALAVERRAEAYKDRASGLLDLIKSMQEIDDVDIEQLKKLIDLARITQGSSETRGVEKNDVSSSPIQEAAKIIK